MVVGFRTTYAISKVVSSIPGLHSIQHYVIYMSVICDRSLVFSGYSCEEPEDTKGIITGADPEGARPP